MKTVAQIEQQLLRAASASDVTSIVSIVSDLSTGQKIAIDRTIFDKALDSISNSPEPDPAVYSHMMLSFLQAVGRHTSPAVICQAFDRNAMPRSQHRTA